jgi:hypothetical protein
MGKLVFESGEHEEKRKEDADYDDYDDDYYDNDERGRLRPQPVDH